ncbi:unannotated protein [freshwater metagenome]|uniref:Unannotated protein n=1 Tax=freshwater metagenome TaxID=449393 RepID=A0A6J7KP85_9ZZZZ
MALVSHERNSPTATVASEIIFSASRFAALESALASRRLSVNKCSALRVAFSRNSSASDSAAAKYLRPRDSAPAKIALALFSDDSKRSFVIRVASATICSAEEVARDSRCCAVLIRLMAVSPARISNSSLLKLVISRRERRSAN